MDLRAHTLSTLGAASLAALTLMACGDGGTISPKDIPAPPRPTTSPDDAAWRSLLEERLAAVEADRTSADAWARLGIAYDAHDTFDGNYKDQAIACYEQAAELAPDRFRWPYLAGTVAYQNDQAGALVWFDRALEADAGAAGGHGPLFVRRGIGKLGLGDLDGARTELDRALEIDADLAVAWLGRARIALQEDDPDAALAALDSAKKAGVQSDEVHGLVAEALRRKGDDEGAAAAAALVQDGGRREPLPDLIRFEVQREGTSLAWVRSLSTSLAQRGDFDNAFAAWRKVVERAPTPEARLEFADFALRAGQPDEVRAQHAALESAALEPAQRARVLVQRGTLSQFEGDLEGAVGHFERAIELDGENSFARGNLGLVLMQRGRVADGLVQLRVAAQQMGPDSDAQVNLLSALVETEQWEEAMVALSALEGARGEDGFTAFSRGRILGGTERFAEAAEAFARASELEPMNELPALNRALALEKAGDEDAALDALRASYVRLAKLGAVKVRVSKALSWRLSTSPDDERVDGPEALRLAREVLSLDPQHPEYLDVMAAAFAAAGQFDRAILHAKISLRKLREIPAGQGPPNLDDLIAQVERRQSAYENSERWRDE